jgi:4-hydroxybenzoate polyprenyltransferase
MQWSKGAFVLLGPAYAAMDPLAEHAPLWLGAAAAFVAFGLAASGCYVVNDIMDREADRAHPRKMHRPIASGRIAPSTALVYAAVLLLAAAAVIALAAPLTGSASVASWLGAVVALYATNVTAYSLVIKRIVMLDVVSLALGFVLRVVGGCVAAGVEPSSWMLNCIFFISMFLAFGKRLGERRTLRDNATAARGVQEFYTTELLRMAVVVTAVASLVTYAGYVQAHASLYPDGLYVHWLTLLPATYGLLRCIVVLERGQYDDPTELAIRDRPLQGALLVFALLTVALMLVTQNGWPISPA